MKKYLLVLILFISTTTFATKITISTSGFNFSPPDVVITQGDTIVFNVGGGHTATEVSHATWDANETTANGAFNLSTGNNQLVVGLTTGTHYYVCQIHVGSMHMKGTISVELPSAVKNQKIDNDLFSIFPNPTKDFLLLKNNGIFFTKIYITNIEGKNVKEITTDKNTEKISIADLPNGEYIFSAYTRDGKAYIRKFIKE